MSSSCSVVASLHVPPFKHGDASHSKISVQSGSRPAKPLGHCLKTVGFTVGVRVEVVGDMEGLRVGRFVGFGVVGAAVGPMVGERDGAFGKQYSDSVLSVHRH